MCNKRATKILIDGDGPDDYTLACDEHERVMKSDTHKGSWPFDGEATCCYLGSDTDIVAASERMYAAMHMHLNQGGHKDAVWNAMNDWFRLYQNRWRGPREAVYRKGLLYRFVVRKASGGTWVVIGQRWRFGWRNVRVWAFFKDRRDAVSYIRGTPKKGIRR